MNQTCSVLLVDDDENDAFFFRRMAGKLPFPVEVFHVRDATEASVFLKRELHFSQAPVPDLVFTDLTLGTETGLDLLRWLRVHPRLRGLPVIILSGSDNPKLRAEAERLGIQGFMTKPTTTAALAGALAPFTAQR